MSSTVPPCYHSNLQEVIFQRDQCVSVYVCVRVIADKGYSFILWPRFEGELNRGHERHGPPSRARVMCNLNTGTHRHSQPSRKHYYAYTHAVHADTHRAHACKNACMHTHLQKKKKKNSYDQDTPEGGFSYGNSVGHTCHSSQDKPVPSLLRAHSILEPGKHAITMCNHWLLLAKQPFSAQNCSHEYSRYMQIPPSSTPDSCSSTSIISFLRTTHIDKMWKVRRTIPYSPFIRLQRSRCGWNKNGCHNRTEVSALFLLLPMQE